jgi:alpha-tubulin suppressor-like RCC1 family protein
LIYSHLVQNEGNFDGQLGIPGIAKVSYPTQLEGICNFLTVSAGNEFSIALDRSGNVWFFGKRGSKKRLIPKIIPTETHITKISAGYSDAIFLDDKGKVWSYSLVKNITEFALHNVIVDIAAGHSHRLFIDCNKQLWASGSNSCGQLGVVSAREVTITQVDSCKDSVRVWAGAFHSFVESSDGNLKAFGDNSHGELGLELLDAKVFHPTIHRLQVQEVFPGTGFTIFVDTNGYIYSCGHNMQGQLGHGIVCDSMPLTKIDYLTFTQPRNKTKSARR